MTFRVDFSIGPVQGFVSQSRRTRDLWGSSFLLAFLSAHAMRGAAEAGGEVVRPLVKDDPLYRWVGGDRTGSSPRIGSIPNRFEVRVEGDGMAVAQAAAASLRGAWARVCEAVWTKYVAAAAAAGQDTEDIWRRQTGSFWDIVWTAEPWDRRSGLLARRKHWRTHRRPFEPGDKCTVMHDMQELSGFFGARNQARQDGFWNQMREEIGSLDLRDRERLCAVAFVKRMFPKVSQEALGWRVDASQWPSTVHVAAGPWIRRASAAAPGPAAAYADAVKRHAEDALSSWHPGLGAAGRPELRDFFRLDANYLHRDFVGGERARLRDGEGADATPRQELVNQLKQIYGAEGGDGRTVAPPPTFYAMVLADGDKLGKLVREIGDAASGALAKFTREVPCVVCDHDGVTVYAGGDDVLAMLPAATALDCADQLSQAYRAAFAGSGATGRATLSAAVVYPQIRLPLGHVRDEAHRLLDKVAKDGNGRDSLATAVLKPGGLHCQWATTWERRGRTAGGVGTVRAVEQLRRLVLQLSASGGAASGISSALLYRLREMLTGLCGWDQWEPGDWSDMPPGLDVRAFLRAEIGHSLEVRRDGDAEIDADDATAAVWSLLPRARNNEAPTRDHQSAGAGRRQSSEIGLDALMLARFLADAEHGEWQ